MLKILALLFVASVAASTLHAEPLPAEKSAETVALQDRIDGRSAEIENMTAYAARLERILVRNGLAAEPWVRQLSFEQRMARVLPPMHAENIRFQDAIKDLADASGVGISVDWKRLRDAGISSRRPLTLDSMKATAPEMLKGILGAAAGGGSVPLDFFIENDTLKVTTAEIVAAHVLTRTYDVAPLLPPDRSLADAQDMIARLISENVATDTWLDAGGSIGKMQFSGTKLTITQSAANLAAIETFLDDIDAKKQNTRRRAILDRQGGEIALLAIQSEKLAARCRAAGIHVPPRVDLAMDQQLPDLEFISVPLATCLARIEQASGQVIAVKWDVLETAGIERDAPITLSIHRETLAGALRAVIAAGSTGNSRVRYQLEDNTIAISTEEDFDRATVCTRVYDLRDVRIPHGMTRQDAVDAIEQAIETRIDPDSWRDNGGTIGNLRELQGQLIVTQTKRAHARIKARLDILRRENGG
ncbi:MAG TPA: hypothetical protein VFE47_12240 [Tepidisphaeraceae bacterium]|jgi:hypothetical protein|nr:hypothetical protein [Tepidisphaeraceae bacterium]